MNTDAGLPTPPGAIDLTLYALRLEYARVGNHNVYWDWESHPTPPQAYRFRVTYHQSHGNHRTTADPSGTAIIDLVTPLDALPQLRVEEKQRLVDRLREAFLATLPKYRVVRQMTRNRVIWPEEGELRDVAD